MKLLSYIETRGSAPRFPAFTGEKIYMRKFYKAVGLPEDLQRWQSVVDAMLCGINTDGPVFLMVDQAEVSRGDYHRRPGLHIDGYWDEILQTHPGPSPYPHNHGINERREGLILTSNVMGCRAFSGYYKNKIREGGDCESIDRYKLEPTTMQPNVIYAGNVGMLHESLPIKYTCQRIVVRLNVPGWEPDHPQDS